MLEYFIKILHSIIAKSLKNKVSIYHNFKECYKVILYES